MAKKVTDVVEKKVDAAEVAKVVAKKATKVAEKTEKVVKEAAKEAEKAVKKTADAAKKTAGRAAAKKAEAKVTCVIQFAGKEVNAETVLAAAKAQYAADNKAAVKDIALYIKPEDNAAYYVVNGEVSGKVEL